MKRLQGTWTTGVWGRNRARGPLVQVGERLRSTWTAGGAGGAAGHVEHRHKVEGELLGSYAHRWRGGLKGT